MLPTLISNLVQASVSVKRLRNFLKNEELDPNIVNWSTEPPASGKFDSIHVHVIIILNLNDTYSQFFQVTYTSLKKAKCIFQFSLLFLA